MNQNQKLLVESKRTWIQRLFGLNEVTTITGGIVGRILTHFF